MKSSSFNRFLIAPGVFLSFLGMSTALIHPNSQAFSQTKQERKAQAKQKTTTEQEPPPAEGGATSTSHLALPFKRLWKYLTDEASSLAPSIDSERIYLPLAGGRVVCLDRETGSLRWMADPGGIISSPVAVGEHSVFIATQKLADDGSEAGGSLRAIDKNTGLTVWVKDYARPFSSPLVIAPNRLYAGCTDGFFYALNFTNGNVIWKVETQDIVRGRPLVAPNAIYFGGDDGTLRSVAPDSGQIIWKYQVTGKIVGQPALDDRAIYFGAGDGYLYSMDLTGKLKWRSRTGAAIEASPVLVGELVLIPSYDNFVYALSKSTGDRVWKRRLENRITSAVVVEGDANLVAPLRGDYVAVFLNADGRRVNLYKLEKDTEIVADPIFSNDTLYLATSNGLVVARAMRPKDQPANAIKK
jgi:outer membrane protein assembly factor BamB